MSLDTFDNLKLEIIDWSHRGDIDLRVETFIELAEQAMYANTVEVLNVRGQEVEADLVTSGIDLALPDDFQSARSLKIVTGSGDIELYPQAPAQIVNLPAPGIPSCFTVTDVIRFNREPDDAYDIKLQYFKIPTPLSKSNQTNEILGEFPSIYLYGALAQVFTFAVDQVEAEKYFSLMLGAIEGANKKDKQGRYGPAPVMSFDGFIP